MLTVLAVTILLCLVPCIFGRIAYEMEDQRERSGGLSDRADYQAHELSSLECH